MVCSTSVADRVIQHMEQMLTNAGLVVHTKMSMVWTASDIAPESPAAKRTRKQAERHDGFVNLGAAIQSEEPDEDEDSRAVLMGSGSFIARWPVSNIGESSTPV